MAVKGQRIPLLESLAKGPVRARAKHAAPTLADAAWRASRRKFAFGTTAVAMSALLAMPTSAFAATLVEVDGNQYNAGNAASGQGWSWDGADDMVLDGYNGGAIYAEGTLNIQLKGENTIVATNNAAASGAVGGSTTALEVVDAREKDAGGNTISIIEEGDLSITGDGSLQVEVESSIASDGIYASGDLGIDGTTVKVNASSSAEGAIGVKADGDLAVNNADVRVTADAKGGLAGVAQGLSSNDISITNSNVEVSISNEVVTDGSFSLSDIGLYEIFAGTGLTGLNVTIADSTVSVSASEEMQGGAGIVAMGMAMSAEGEQVATEAPVLSIKNSDVTIEGLAMAVGSFFVSISDEGSAVLDQSQKGTIVIEGGTITTPAGASIQDLKMPFFEVAGLREIATVYGQAIGTGEGVIASYAEGRIAGDISIERATEDEVLSSAKGGLPQTGDAAKGVVPIAGAGLTAAAAAAYSRRKAIS